MTSISIETGTEGPIHDPYGWEEITVTRPSGDVVTLHSGLDCWVERNGERFRYAVAIALPDEKEEWRLLCEKFEETAGCTPTVARAAYERVRATCPRCNVITPTYCQDGMPGETLEFCCICDSVVNCDFNEAAIM